MKKIRLIHRTCVLTWICSKPHSNVNEFGLFYISNSKPKVSNLHKTHPNHAHIRACYTLFPFSTPTTWHSLKTHFHLTDVQQDPRAMPSLSSQQVQKHRESFYKDPDWKPLISQLYIWIHVSLHLLAAQLIIMYTCIQPTYNFAFHKIHKFSNQSYWQIVLFFCEKLYTICRFHAQICVYTVNEWDPEW